MPDVSAQLRGCLPVAASARGIARELHSRVAPLCRAAWFYRLQSQPGPIGRLLDRATADGSLVVSALRNDGGAERAGHDPRVVVVQSQLPCDWRALHQRRHPAFMQLLTADLFADFPDLRFIIPHGGGAVPYHWGRYRGLAQDMKRPLLKDYLLKNVFFDTCVYHQPGTDLLAKVIPVENILFASETIGAVQGIDPETGHYYDDTRRYIDAIPWLTPADRQRIYEDNARAVYGRLSNQLDIQLNHQRS